MKMTTQYIKLKNLININTKQEVCPQYNNRKVDYSRSQIEIGKPLRICDLEGMFFQHELIVNILEDIYSFSVVTTKKMWFFEYCNENWNSIGGDE